MRVTELVDNARGADSSAVWLMGKKQVSPMLDLINLQPKPSASNRIIKMIDGEAVEFVALEQLGAMEQALLCKETTPDRERRSGVVISFRPREK